MNALHGNHWIKNSSQNLVCNIIKINFDSAQWPYCKPARENRAEEGDNRSASKEQYFLGKNKMSALIPLSPSFPDAQVSRGQLCHEARRIKNI